MDKPARDTSESGLRLLPEPEPMAVQDIREALVIREGDIFLLTEPGGDIHADNIHGYGLYRSDTRYLSEYDFSFAHGRPIPLLSTAELGFSSEHVLTNVPMKDSAGRDLPRGTIQLRRLRVLDEMLEETIRVVNYNPFEVDLELLFRISADFADLFEVRGFERKEPGEFEPARYAAGQLALSYKGRDGHRRQTCVSFTPSPDSLETDGDVALASFRVSLKAQESSVINLLVSLDGETGPPRGLDRFTVVKRRYESWTENATRIQTDNDFFNAVLQRSIEDLRMLRTPVDSTHAYPAAGTPWYDTLFGRDTCIVGLQTLAFKPELARECLASLARWQGKKFDPWRDEEPGKILHELREGELTLTGELPFSPYYGTVDATPLFLWLAGEYYRWTADIEFLAQMETNLRAGLYWIEHYGDHDDDGYIEYEKRSTRGLVNQGWKDSEDSLIHKDGNIIQPPIALVEVQAYAYAAYTALAPVFEKLGDHDTARRLRHDAAELRSRFNRHFWLAEDGYYALALDGDNVPAASITSNAGHALWSGIATKVKARQVADRMLADDMFSGWGIRTLSSQSPRYNPQGYHLGTIWPHDNSICAMGLKRYGFEGQLNIVASCLFEAARQFPYYRLPELFGGGVLSPHQTPVPYPVACRPQAWAAGAMLLIAQAILGLYPDAPRKRLLVVQPVLPRFLRRVHVQRVRVGHGEADLLFERHGAQTRLKILSIRGELEVEKVRKWPMRSSTSTDEPPIPSP
jgi:glycogen debranching enzyme